MILNITDRAVSKLKALRPAVDHVLRIQVTGGGCSGMSYKLDFVYYKDITSGGYKQLIVGTFPDVLLVSVDDKSALFLEGSTIDHSDGLNGRGFEFVNPQAKTTCGCGMSFGV